MRTITRIAPPLLTQFENKVKQNSSKPVLVTENKTLTFKELDCLTDSLACQLINEFGNQRVIPVYTQDNMYSIMAILAIWKAGKIYLPFNPGTPVERMIKIMRDLKAESLWSDEKIQSLNVKGFKTETDVFQFDRKYEEIAYVLTTSGSTGEPKKVEVTHKNIDWLLSTMQLELPFGSDDRFLVSTPPAFDVSLHEMFAFIYGDGQIVTYPSISTIQKVKRIPEFLNKFGVTHLALSPSACEQLFKRLRKQPEKANRLTHLLLAGEELPVYLAKDIFESQPNISLYNLYGPTETTIYATLHKVDKAKCKYKVPIGKNLSGTEIKFIDENNKLNESKGEIIIGGQGVTNGYLDNLELTEKQFININGNTYYKTGDYGYWDEVDQVIIYEGRKDEQVQVNGIRVEIGEIDAAVKSILPSHKCKTIYTNRQLVLFIETDYMSDKSIEELINRLKNTLPSYMVPADVFPVSEFTMTANRKLDQKRLISLHDEARNQNHVNINNTVIKEEKNFYLQLSKEIINLFNKEIDIDQNIVKILHLDSLAQLELILHLEDNFQVKFPDDALLQYPTIKSLGSYITENRSVTEGTFMEYNRLNFEQIEDNLLANAFLMQENPKEIRETYYIQKCYYIDNFSQVLSDSISVPKTLNKKKLEEIITKLIYHHSILQTTLTENKETVKFEHYDLTSWSFRLLDLDEISGDDHQKVLEILKKKSINFPLWYFLYESKKSKLNIFINHSICDQSSLNLLKKDLYKLINGEALESLQNDYWDFINYQDKQHDKSLEYLSEVDNLGFSMVEDNDLLSNTMQNLKYISFDRRFISNEECITFTNYVLLQALARGQNKTYMSGSTILDIREFEGFNANGIIGDIHSTIPLVSKQGESYKEFEMRILSLLEKTKKGHNVNHYLYRTYPIIQEEIKHYEFTLDDNLKFSANYLGALREEEVFNMIENLQSAHIALKSFSTKKWYVTFFHTGRKLIIVPLSNPDIDIATIESLGGRIYSETE